jgi:hypothetical protein
MRRAILGSFIALLAIIAVSCANNASEAKVSSSADLLALGVDSGSLSPAFSATTTEYSLLVENAVSSVTVTGIKADASATVSEPVTLSGLVAGVAQTATIRVTAPNGTVKAYTVAVTRKSPPSGRAIIADHRAVEAFADIPQAYIEQVKNMLFYIYGESHSTSFGYGPELLAARDSRYPAVAAMIEKAGEAHGGIEYPWSSAAPSYPPFDPANPRLRIYRGYAGESSWFTNPNSVAAMPDQLRRLDGQGVTALGFGWCADMTSAAYPDNQSAERDPVYRVRWSGRSYEGPQGDRAWGLDAEDFATTGNTINMDTYLEATQGYVDYCAANGLSIKPFFTTGPIDDSFESDAEKGYARELKHARIRAWVNDHDGLLFDFADILSYNDAGQASTGSWTDDLGLEHSFPTFNLDNGFAPYSAYHFGETGAIRVAKAMWWFLARLAGWDGLPAGER